MDIQQTEKIKEELIDLVSKGNAHVSLKEVLKKIPYPLITKTPKGLPYSIWELTYHLQLSQNDILKFITQSDYIAPDWPKDYWPKNKIPTEKEWEDCKKGIEKDMKAFIGLIKKSDMDELLKPIPWGSGQTIFKEALVIADHNSYHTGEILVLMRLLGAWN